MNRGWRYFPYCKYGKYWRNLLLFALALLVLGVFAELAGLARNGALGYVHPTRVERAANDTPARYGTAYRSVELTAEDGVKLAGWYAPPRNGVVILLAHGYGVARPADLFARLARHGYGVIAWDFRAHGESEGRFCSLGYYETLDVKAALAFARKQPGVEHVGALGQSMGAATVIRASAQWPAIEAVVADSAYPSVDMVLAGAVPIPPLRPLVRFYAERETGVSMNAVRPVDDIARISPRPVFVIQGAQDSLVPPTSAQALFNAAGEPRFIWIGAGMGHVQMAADMAEEYERRVIEFFDQKYQI